MTQGERRARLDGQTSRALLLNGIERAVSEKGPRFSLSELATFSGVPVATAYRHFHNADAAIAALYDAVVDNLGGALLGVSGLLSPSEQFREACAIWVDQAMQWGPTVVQLRSSRGPLGRLRAGDEVATRLYKALAPILERLVTEGLIAEQPLDFAAMMWMTLFDERVVIDLADAYDWSPVEVSRCLSASVLLVLGSAPDIRSEHPVTDPGPGPTDPGAIG